MILRSIAVHDAVGIDPRGWRYAEQLTAAGIAVLHLELYDTSADGAGPLTEGDAAAPTRLATAAATLVEDPRFGGMRLGILAFGAAGETALRAAVAPGLGEHIAALALLYPGCATLRDAAVAVPRSPVLLLHGDADPANPLADCAALAARLARGAPVRHIRYAGAGYAWDCRHPASRRWRPCPGPAAPPMAAGRPPAGDRRILGGAGRRLFRTHAPAAAVTGAASHKNRPAPRGAGRKWKRLVCAASRPIP